MEAFSCPVFLLAVMMMPPATSLEDLARFPTLGQASRAMEFNMAYKEWLDLQYHMRSHHADWFGQAIKETSQLWWIWDCLRYAHSECHPTDSRLYWLEELRQRIGEEDYAAGIMPPPVPMHRFQLVR